MNPEFIAVIDQVESAIRLKDWKHFKELYEVWHIEGEDFDYLPSVIVKITESDEFFNCENVLLNEETFMLIDDCDYECG